MRVGIDGACWLNRRGYGRFTRELVRQLVAVDTGVEYTLVVDFDLCDALPVPPGLRVVRSRASRPAAHAAAASGRRALGDLWATARAFSRERFDVAFFPSVYTYVPLIRQTRIAVVIHDIIAEQFPAYVFPNRRAALLWQLKVMAARMQADLILTVSEASRQGLLRHFRVPPERVSVVSEAADPMFRPQPYDAAARAVLERWQLCGQPFLLYVGGISPHKNLPVLIQAFGALHADPRFRDCRLLIVGDDTSDVFYSAAASVRASVATQGLGRAVTFTGYVDDATLVSLYNAARALVLPSLDEGFGLPAIEAMACGTPVVASARGALPEVIGDAGLLFAPGSAAELQGCLTRILDDAALQARLRRHGLRRAAQFSWRRAAEETAAALQGLMATPASPRPIPAKHRREVVG